MTVASLLASPMARISYRFQALLIYLPVLPSSATHRMMDPRTVQATPPDESEWSFPALMAAFGASLPFWMRRFGVQPSEAKDATQDALIEAWQGLSKFPAARDQARHEMLRVVSRVAQRYRRRAARLVYVDELEARDSRDVEAWIAARMLWLEALYRLDEPSRALLIAYLIDERTHKQIGDAMGKKEDAIRKRVKVAEAKLREELEKLLGKNKRRNGLGISTGVVFVFDPFDRAVLRTILDVEEEFDIDTAPASSVRPKARTNSWPWQCVPTGVLAAALFLVPGQGWRTEPLSAAKMGNPLLSAIEVRSDVSRRNGKNSSATPDPFPRKTNLEDRQAQPALSAKDAAIVKKLREKGRRFGQPKSQ